MWRVAFALAILLVAVSLIDTFSTPLIHRTVFDWTVVVLGVGQVIWTGLGHLFRSGVPSPFKRNDTTTRSHI